MDFHGRICEKIACNRGDVDSYIRSSSPGVLELLKIIRKTKGSDEIYLICRSMNQTISLIMRMNC